MKPVTHREWWFIPDNPWKNSIYQVEFNVHVGDLVNNYLHRPFEVKEIKSYYPNIPINLPSSRKIKDLRWLIWFYTAPVFVIFLAVWY
jgi:hypothetical protein